MENKLFETLKMKAAEFEEIRLDELSAMVSDPYLKARLEEFEWVGYILYKDVTVDEDNGKMYIEIYNYSGGLNHKVTVKEDNVEEAINDAARILLESMESDAEDIVDYFSSDLYGDEVEEDGKTLFVYDVITSNYKVDVRDILDQHRADLDYDPDDLEWVKRDGAYRYQRVIA